MEQREYTTHDRSGWDSGPWDGEPDKVQFVDEATKLPCLAVRNHSGAWCGYVGVPPSHKDFGKGYSDVDYDVHGGLTFADKCQPTTDESHGICHVPAPGEPDHVWWFGFDCNHCDDFAPSMHFRLKALGHDFRIPGEKYRTLGYVKAQCAKLAAQLVTE